MGQPVQPGYGAAQPGYGAAAYPPQPQPVVVQQQPAVVVQQQPAIVVQQQQPVVVVQQKPVTTVTTTVTNNVVRAPARFGEASAFMTCPNCQQNINTRTTYKLGALVWIIVLIMFFFGFWLCICIPCCIPACQDVEHTCPNCNTRLGTFNRLS